MIIAGTGHRPIKLGGDAVQGRLVDLAVAVLKRHEPTAVISGMALGWDQALADAAVRFGIPLHAMVPFEGQEDPWPEYLQTHYHNLLKAAAKVTIVTEGGYTAAAMQKRNVWMVDQCDLVVALWNGSEGGTAHCVRYAERVGKPVKNYWSAWVKYR